MPMDERGEKVFEIKFTRLPSVMCRGSGALEGIGRSLDLIGDFTNGLIICDPTTYDIAGKTTETLLLEKGMKISVFRIQDATKEILDAAMKRIVHEETDIVFGVGGGRPIDIAKKSSFDSGIPFVSVPTAPSHDGIGSARASIKVDGTSASLKAHPPAIIVADTTILANAPYRYLAAGCGDVISNITAVRDWELGRDEHDERFSEYAAELSSLAAKLLIRHAIEIPGKTEYSTRIVINALITSSMAMAVADSSRPASGAEHKFSHSLDRIADRPALHGEQCALGTIVCSYLQGGDWQMLRQVMLKIGIPTTAEMLGISRELVIRALVEAKDIRPERYTILRDGLSHREAEEALSHVGIIQ